MAIAPSPSLSRQTLAAAITLYQQYLSPYKGFSCAHRVLHRRESCSHYAKRMIVEHGWWQAIPLIQERFEDCRVAHQILVARRQRQTQLQPRPVCAIEESPDPGDLPPDLDAMPPVDAGMTPEAIAAVEPKRQSSCRDSTCDALDCADGLDDALDCVTDISWLDCGSLDCSGLDCSSLDCSSLDCSSLDCGSLDCGSLDCGSCG